MKASLLNKLDALQDRFEELTGEPSPVRGGAPVNTRDDQVAPFTPADTRIAELQKAGVNARMIALAGISHYQTHRFQDALRQAAPWLHEVWK